MACYRILLLLWWVVVRSSSKWFTFILTLYSVSSNIYIAGLWVVFCFTNKTVEVTYENVVQFSDSGWGKLCQYSLCRVLLLIFCTSTAALVPFAADCSREGVLSLVSVLGFVAKLTDCACITLALNPFSFIRSSLGESFYANGALCYRRVSLNNDWNVHAGEKLLIE